MIFADRCVTYDIFCNDIAVRLFALMSRKRDLPEKVSLRKAYEEFGGRARVDGWIKRGLITPIRSGNRCLLNTAELITLDKY